MPVNRPLFKGNGTAGIMKKSIKVAPNRESRPPTRGRDPHVAARMPSSLIAEVEAWAAANNTSRSDAFRQLVELGLARTKSAGSTSAKSAERARQLAAKTIDGLIDPGAPAEETASRKRRLLKGPEEFREVRVDSGKETRSAGWSG
jgi:ribbon-helix-helix CopG family protein